jgi:hypothetical protein
MVSTCTTYVKKHVHRYNMEQLANYSFNNNCNVSPANKLYEYQVYIPPRSFWSFKSSEMLGYIFSQTVPDASKDRNAFIFLTLKMKARRSFETSGIIWLKIVCHIAEDLQQHRCQQEGSWGWGVGRGVMGPPRSADPKRQKILCNKESLYTKKKKLSALN